MKQMTAALAAVLSNLGNDPVQDIRFKAKTHPNKKMPLTDEELQELSNLSGKEKKKFLKTLREKYGL